MREKYIVSYGGGVDSTAMIFKLVQDKAPLDYVVFADTGNEHPETYFFVKQYMKPYLESKNIPFVTVYPFKKRSLWIRCFQRKVIPDMLQRWCTRDVKVKPIHKFYKTLKSDIIQYMGIDYQESHRMKPSGENWITNSYPLVDHKMNREDCIKLIESLGFPVPVKSGCFFCPYNSKSRWSELKQNYPTLYKLAQELETNNKHQNQTLIRLTEKDETNLCDGVCMT